MAFTTPAETGVCRCHVLVDAMDADARQHRASRVLLEAARDPAITFYVTSQILCEFYAVVTNGRRVSKPRTSTDALRAITALLAVVRVLPVPASAVQRQDGLASRHEGDIVHMLGEAAEEAEAA